MKPIDSSLRAREGVHSLLSPFCPTPSITLDKQGSVGTSGWFHVAPRPLQAESRSSRRQNPPTVPPISINRTCSALSESLSQSEHTDTHKQQHVACFATHRPFYAPLFDDKAWGMSHHPRRETSLCVLNVGRQQQFCRTDDGFRCARGDGNGNQGGGRR